MTTIKSYTDIEQSKKLAEILPLQSADMHYGEYCAGGENYPIPNCDDDYNGHCCWSLAALLEQLPYELCDDDGNLSYLQIDKEDEIYQLVYEDPYGYFESIETDRYEHFVDACVAMIEKLHKLKML